ncbi:MAG TPA: hypothetical protein ENL18_02130 [Thermoplasmatales archaeon]|nr:hypothetical protein [Thermoplasmatales archaeon]
MTKFSYAKLRSLERMERQSPELTNIGNDFYRSAFEYIKELEKRFDEEMEKNPSSKKVSLISDELRNTRRIWESIFERREKKVVQAALSAARGGSHTPKSLTEQEKIFYGELLEILRKNREMIFGGQTRNIKKEESDGINNDENKGDEEDKQKDINAVNGGGSNGNKILRILKDVPPFVGADMKKYSLKKEDIITMPDDTANILLKRGAAEEVKVPAGN